MFIIIKQMLMQTHQSLFVNFFESQDKKRKRNFDSLIIIITSTSRLSIWEKLASSYNKWWRSTCLSLGLSSVLTVKLGLLCLPTDLPEKIIPVSFKNALWFNGRLSFEKQEIQSLNFFYNEFYYFSKKYTEMIKYWCFTR